MSDEVLGTECLCSNQGCNGSCELMKVLDPTLCRVVMESRRLCVLHELRRELDTDLLGVDCKFVIFGMAVQSYRYEELMVPHPPVYCSKEGYDIEALNLTMGTMPDLSMIQRQLFNNVIPTEQLDLLHWLLIQSGTPRLQNMLHNDQLLLWRQLEQKPQPRPQLVFRVQPRNQVKPEPLESCVFYCGEMEELFSLIALPHPDVSKAEFELCDDLVQACGKAEWSPGWGYSLCGTLLRCVAICQLRQVAAELPQRLQVRYLLIYSMNYTYKMERIRNNQWKILQEEQLKLEQLARQRQQEDQDDMEELLEVGLELDQRVKQMQLEQQQRLEQKQEEQLRAEQAREDQERKDEERKDQEQKDHGLKDLELKDLELKDQELKDQELKDQELKDQEVKDQELKDQELKDEELKDQELKDEELKDKEWKDKEQNDKEWKDKELKDQELKDQEHRDQEVNDQELKNQEVKDQEVKDQELKDQELKDQERKDQELKDQELKDQELKDQELKDQELKDQELKDQEVKDQELKDQELKDKELKDQQREEQQREDQELEKQQLKPQKRTLYTWLNYGFNIFIILSAITIASFAMRPKN